MAKRASPLKTADSVIEQNLDARIRDLEQVLAPADAIAFCGPIYYGIDGLIREAVEFRFGTRAARKKRLVVILETTGGYIEVAQRIVQVFRKHYREVEFIVPSYAMSAGTVLALSGDAIYMDYFSILGPIDPQVKRDGVWLPALGYLEMFERFIAKSSAGTLTTAEAGFLIAKFNPAELYSFEQARNLSISLLKEWLVKYKFKNWKKTKTRKMLVTKKMKAERATEIAELLNKTEEWHSHGRGISMDVLRRKVKLEIDDFEKNKALRDAMRQYYDLLQHYIMRRGQMGVIHVAERYIPLFGEL